MKTNWVGYDIETAGDLEEYALQPWRAREGTGRITHSCMWGKSVTNVVLTADHHRPLNYLRHHERRVALWNGVFDLAWLYAAGHDISGIMWYDAMLMWKWWENSQNAEHQSYSLRSGALEWLQDWPKLEEFISIKDEKLTPVADMVYWRERVAMDAEATALIAEKVWPLLTPQQQRAVTVQAIGLPTIAASWVNGVHVDKDKIEAAERPILEEMLEIEIKLGLTHAAWLPHVREHGPASYEPCKILRSPQQLAGLLYSTWGHTCERYTDKGAESSDKIALTYLTDHDHRVIDILKWKELNTQWTKFIKGPLKAIEYLTSDIKLKKLDDGGQWDIYASITHSQPKMFSTYTGRMTYSSKQQKKIPIGIALHQTPRKKEVRSYVVAPPGHYIVEFDAQGQEMRGMATMSGDSTMITMFNSPAPYNNGHAMTGAALGSMLLGDFIEQRAAGVEAVAGAKGLYNAGKFCNLSMGYRTGFRTLRIKARVDYGITLTDQGSKDWKIVYLTLYPGVKEYWKIAPQRAKLTGYAETLAGRRYGITRYGGEYTWGSESSAINFPIQGMGADQRDLAIATIVMAHPELWDKFYFDLHDGMYFVMPYDWPVSYVAGVLRTLNEIDYNKHWGVELPVPYTWECSFGPNWGSKVEYEDHPFDMTLEQYYKEQK